ncbi:hypothetical protein VPH35_084630 [Triticum aestivum]
MAPPAVVGFSDLPTEALDEITRRSGPLDNVLCSAVCRSWRRALRTARLGRLQEPNRPHSIFLHTEAREVVLEVSSIHRRQQEELRTELLSNYKDMFHKAALAPGRRLGTYAVMLIHSDGRGLSFLRPGDSSWRTARSARATPHRYLDVVFHKGAFCTLSSFGEVNAWTPDGGGGLRTRRLTDQRPEQLAWAVLAYTMDRPMCYERRPLCCPRRRQHFEVSRCDERQRRWLPVKDIGETAILSGSHSNHIYFASDCATSNIKCDYGNPDYYRMPIAAESLAGREISGWTWFLPYVARLDYGAS